ncbi:unnamed protein product [Urochloa decumbens]|uniref:KIB1-4 beta-propeller domain-containing protein n=1 Tax=Urochloa decumbens TaxID=240449 RepID=A0ABC9B4Z2_9POAL
MSVGSEDSPRPRRHDLPSDPLGDISGRLHAAGDYARFHAACKSWRDSLPPPARRPTLLPWLLSPRDAAAATGHRTARCVLSSSTAVTKVHDHGRTWVIRAEDGVAYWLVSGEEASVGLVDPFTGSRAATLSPFPDEIAAWVSRAYTAAGAIYGDGTILLYAFCPTSLYSSGGVRVTSNATASNLVTLNVALLCPGTSGATAWTSVQRKLCVCSKDMEIFCFAYNNGNIILCYKREFVRIVPGRLTERRTTTFSERWQHWPMRYEPGGDQERFQSGYLVESRGELLLACVEIDNSYWKSWECHVDIESLVKAPSVSVHVLQDDEAQGIIKPPRWVKRDGRSFLADRVLFLGRPSSFAVEAARLGMDGGCAYFLDKRRLYQGNVARDRCRLLKYSFRNGRSEFVEELPAEWTCKAGMWITPQPAIATSTVT